MKDFFKFLATASERIDTAKSYHNTTQSKGSELKQREGKANKQEQDVLQLFYKDANRMLSPEQALNYFQSTNPTKYGNVPITSIRRAFSNLSSEGRITQSNSKIMGDYGRMVSIWKLKE